MANINSLLNELNNITNKCENFYTINESIDIDAINKKFREIGRNISNFGNFSEIRITEELEDLIDRACSIHLTNDFRISLYSNIHNVVKFDIKAGVAIDYIVDKIYKSIDNPNIDFNVEETVQEAIAFAFKTCTNKSIDKKMSLSEFKDKYWLHAFGSRSRSSYIKPDLITLARLCRRTPMVISYIDKVLIHNHISYLHKYMHKLESEFNKLVKNNESLEPMISKYIRCFKLGTDSTLSMYKLIRNIFIELFVEYKRIFNEIIRIDNDLRNSNLNESITFFNKQPAEQK
jgi:hypothetical protein